MTDTETLEARLDAVVARLEAMTGSPGISQFAATTADGSPGNVAAGELVEAAWGNAVVDVHKIPSTVYTAGVGALAHTSGKLQIEAMKVMVTTNSNGDASIGFVQAFVSPPLVVACSEVQGIHSVYVATLDPNTAVSFTIKAFIAPTVLINTAVRVSYIAIGRRP